MSKIYAVRFPSLLSKIPIAVCLSTLLVGFALLRIALVAFHSPLLGWGNNWDFIREAACTGVWPSLNGHELTAPTQSVPLNNLEWTGHIDRNSCFISSDDAFATLARTFRAVGSHIDFRWISFWRLVFLATLLVAAICRAEQVEMLIVSLMFFLVFGDLTNILYFNTLYNDFSVLFGFFFSFVFFALALNRNVTINKLSIVFSCFVILWLSLSKQQDFPLAMVFSVANFLAFYLHRNMKSIALLFLCVGFLGCSTFVLNHRGNTGLDAAIARANITDTVLGAVLPAASDKKAALKTLGLPPVCNTVIGDTWYSPSFPTTNPCPMVYELSRVDLIKLFIKQPQTFYKPMSEATALILPFSPYDYLGWAEDAANEQAPVIRSTKYWSTSNIYAIIAKKTVCFFALPLIAEVIFGVIAITAIKNTKKPTDDLDLQLVSMVLLGGFFALYDLASSVFGDGLLDIPRHAMLFAPSVSFQLVGVLFYVGRRVSGLRAHET